MTIPRSPTANVRMRPLKFVMGNEQSLVKFRRGSKEKAVIIIDCDEKPTFTRKKSKRSVSALNKLNNNEDNKEETSRLSPEVPKIETPTTMGTRKISASNLRAAEMLCPPTPDRRRSRSLCQQQMENDAQTVAAGVGGDKTARKSSSGLVPSLNRLRIQSSFKTAKPSLGDAIVRRAGGARSELRTFLYRLPDSQTEDLGVQMYTLISEAVMNIEKSDEALSHARRFGESYAALIPNGKRLNGFHSQAELLRYSQHDLKRYEDRIPGFRPDYFAVLADAAIAECVRLDAGNHKRCDTLLAWSQLIGALFTAVRDGYYQRVRYQRRSSLPQHNNLTKQMSVDMGQDPVLERKLEKIDRR